jgi:tRNA-dihydrouridine synthase C
MSRILLAPMEGLADDLMRGVLTADRRLRLGNLRIHPGHSNSVLPVRTYERICPELLTGSRTVAGTPMRVQLLGSDPHFMAENARRLVTLNPAGWHRPQLRLPGADGQSPSWRRRAARRAGTAARHRRAVRAVVPADIPFTAKMRLGIDDTSLAVDCARALEAGAASTN